jgi:hypothetical protein
MAWWVGRGTVGGLVYTCNVILKYTSKHAKSSQNSFKFFQNNHRKKLGVRLKGGV